MNKKIIISLLIISIILICYYNYFFNVTNNSDSIINKPTDNITNNSIIIVNKPTDNITNKLNNINTKNNAIYVYDRKNNIMIKEFIPLYIRISLKLMYNLNLCKYNKLIKKISTKQGEKFNRQSSKKYIEKFIKLYNINIDETEKNIIEYKTFNEFFARKLKYNLRPIFKLYNNNVAICPADSRVLVFNNILHMGNFWIKGNNLSLEKLFSSEYERLIQNYKDCSICISRLAPQDYHRWHLPIRGIIIKHTLLDGNLCSVNPILINKNINILAENKRIITEIISPEFGKVIIIPIGTIFVGSIKIILEENIMYNKGEPHGYFQFGGSTVLLLFEKNRIMFDQDLIDNSKNGIETLVNVNTSLGVSY